MPSHAAKLCVFVFSVCIWGCCCMNVYLLFVTYVNIGYHWTAVVCVNCYTKREKGEHERTIKKTKTIFSNLAIKRRGCVVVIVIIASIHHHTHFTRQRKKKYLFFSPTKTICESKIESKKPFHSFGRIEVSLDCHFPIFYFLFDLLDIFWWITVEEITV